MGYVFGVFIRVTLEGEVIIREVPRHPEIVELKSPQPASAPLQEPPIQADPVDIGINDNVNAQNYGELENIEVLQNGDILPGHDFVLGDPETYGRELLVVNTGPDSPIRPVLDQAKIMGDAMKQSGCSTLEIAEAIARMVNEEFAKGQGHNIGNAGEAMTIGVFMEGGGCCRHRAALLQLALQEAGIKSHYVRGEASIGGGESGMHAWVEIDAKGDSSFSYVIDPNLHVSGWVKPQINNNGMKTYKLGKFGIFSYSVDPAQHNVVWRPNNAEVQQASSAQGVWFEDGYQVHDDLAEIEIPTGNALYFRFAIEGAETWEIVRLNNGRYFLRNQQGELREITKDSPVLFKDSNSQTVLILAINDGKLNIQDSSTNGILYEKNFHPLAEGILESVAPAVPPLTVEMLSETVPDINYINDVIIPAQVGEIAPGIERPAAAEGTPGALVEISNREVVVISDLHESLTNLDLFLSKYSEQISQGKILVFDGDALHDGFDMADSIKMMKAILNLYAMHPESVIYVQGNHDHAWGKELGKINNKGIIPVGELFKMELLKQLGQEYAISLENFFNNCPLAVIVKNQGVTAIIGHALVPSAENLANLPVAFNRDTLINARSYDDLAFAMTWNRPQGYDHKRLFTQADVKKMLELLGLPEDTLVVLGHTTNGNKDSAYVPNGFENVVILMSKYDSSLSVVEINLDQAEVMDLNGQSPIGGMVFSTSAQPSAAAAGQ
jgi:predicted phosphodiesterase